MPTQSTQFALSEEHLALQKIVRMVVREPVAPHAAAVDETGTFPQGSYDALRAAELHAAHVPSCYGGQGADALATCLVIEEVARGCGATSLIPAVNKLGSLPILIAGTEEQKQTWLRPLAAGSSLCCYCLSEPEAGSDVASMRTRAVQDSDGWLLTGTKRWITNAGEGDVYVTFAVTQPEGDRGNMSAPSSSSGQTSVSPLVASNENWGSKARRLTKSISTECASQRIG